MITQLFGFFQPDLSRELPPQVKELTMTVNQLRRDVERRETQVSQLSPFFGKVTVFVNKFTNEF